MMARTLRAFGGQFENCPLLAKQPRSGPSIADSALRDLEQVQVTYIRRPLRHRFDWLGVANRPWAAVIADEVAKTRHVAWLDAAVFVVKEPSALDAPEYEAHEVLACVEEHGPVSAGLGDRFEPFWQAMAEGAGIDGVPFVNAGRSGKRIRLHFNSGVFRFRRGSGAISSCSENSTRCGSCPRTRTQIASPASARLFADKF
jgi:hypothetical protein